MQIFTYCSYKNSRNGFQYAKFRSNVGHIIKSEIKTPKGNISSEFREFVNWCENITDWQLVVERVPHAEKYLVMVGQLEKSRKLNETGKKDSDFYMTLGFSGSFEEIKPIAIYLLKAYNEDGFRSLFDKLENTISKSDDAMTYKIDAKKFNKIFPKVRTVSTGKDVKKLEKLIKTVQKTVQQLDTNRYLTVKRAKAQQEDLKTRKHNIDMCVERLKTMENFSKGVLLIIAYSDSQINEQINAYIRIDYEYKLKQG